jgi:hypothetical protein
VPARTSHQTASTNKRLSSPWRPLSPFLRGISGSIRCHCPYVNTRRIKIALPSGDLEPHSRVGGNPPLMSTGPSRCAGDRSMGACGQGRGQRSPAARPHR